MAFAADNFDSLTAGTSLDGRTASDSGTWTSRDVANAIVGATGGAKVTTANSTRAGYYHSATPASADYSVALDITATSTGVTTMGPAARMDTATNTQYFARWSGSTGWQLWKRVSGTDTQLGSSQNTQAPTTVKTATLTVNGTTISLDVTGASSPLISVTDSAITAAGKAGIYDYFADTGNKDSGDNFSAAALGVTVALTGQGATTSAGTISPANSVAASGSVATASPGTVVPAMSFALSGSAGSLAAGTLNPGLDTALAGLVLTASGGALTAIAPVVPSGAGGGRRKRDEGWRAFTEYREAIQQLRQEAAKQRPKMAKVVQAIAKLEATEAPVERLNDLDQIRTGALSQEAIRALHALYRRWQDEDDEDDIEMLLLS